MRVTLCFDAAARAVPRRNTRRGVVRPGRGLASRGASAGPPGDNVSCSLTGTGTARRDYTL
eukprot:scaffold1035_cov374-Prasinococcus_capsulatus_cf.AAC.6